MNKFDELESFVAVVDANGFSAAGDKLGVAKSILSRRVSDLEKRLGVQLLRRTTRTLSLTDTGRHFYQRSIALLADLEDAEQMVSAAHCSLSGMIKISAPLGIGTAQLANPVAEFMLQHPDIKVSIDLNDRQIDLVSEDFDLAVRVGQLQDSSLIARKLARVNFAICASPEYLKRHGEPMHPSDLSQHQVTVYSNASVAKQWFYLENEKRVNIRISSRLSANNGELLAEIATRGLAITSGPLFYLQDYIDSGKLVPVLQGFPLPEAGMYVVYPPGKIVSRRIKMLSDSLLEYFRDIVL